MSGSSHSDLIQQATQPPDLVQDLDVGPAHWISRLPAPEDVLESRIEDLLFGLLVWFDLLDEELVDLVCMRHDFFRLHRADRVRRCQQTIKIGSNGQMLGLEPSGQGRVGLVEAQLTCGRAQRP